MIDNSIRPVRVASFPPMSDASRNPYLFLIKKNFQANDVEVVESTSKPSFIWLLKHVGSVDVLHFHWLQYHYINVSKLKADFFLVFLFSLKLIVAKLIGYKIVWTAHNIQSHENICPKTDKFLVGLMLVLCNAVICHCEYAKRELQKIRQCGDKIFVSRLPNFIGIYSNETDKAAARKALGIESKEFVYLFLGEIRAYKGLEDLIEAFKISADTTSLLLIAGKAMFAKDKIKLDKLSDQNGRIKMHAEFIADDNLQNYLHSADIVVFPFRSITMSSSLLLAMSFSKPVIAPKLGGIPEYVDSSCGILYDPNEPDALTKVFGSVDKEACANLGYQALQRVSPWTWEKLSQEMACVYRAA